MLQLRSPQQTRKELLELVLRRKFTPQNVLQEEKLKVQESSKLIPPLHEHSTIVQRQPKGRLVPFATFSGKEAYWVSRLHENRPWAREFAHQSFT